MDALSIAGSGMTNASDRLTTASSRIANMSTPGQDVDVAEEMVNVLEAKQQFTACAQVMKFSNEMWKALIDAQRG